MPFPKRFTIRSSHFSVSGGVALAKCEMKEIVAGSVVHAYTDAGSDGEFWSALPSTFQYSTLDTHELGYLYQPGAISLTVMSPEPLVVRASVNVLDGDQLPVVVVAP